MKTNVLVQYKGGGYDGCFWEWNYFYIDKQGKFYDISSSGRCGIDNLLDAELLIADEANSTYIYDMGNDEDIATFCKESNAVHVIGVLQWFNDNYSDIGVEFFTICETCGERTTEIDDIILNGMLLCGDCYATGCCPCCESYVGDTEIVEVDSDEHYGLDYICIDCKDHHDEQREAENLEDLRFQAFCTGKPDIFSEELRSFWV